MLRKLWRSLLAWWNEPDPHEHVYWLLPCEVGYPWELAMLSYAALEPATFLEGFDPQTLQHTEKHQLGEAIGTLSYYGKRAYLQQLLDERRELTGGDHRGQ